MEKTDNSSNSCEELVAFFLQQNFNNFCLPGKSIALKENCFSGGKTKAVHRILTTCSVR